MEASGAGGGTRVGRVFKTMRKLCPLEIAAFGKCLIAKEEVLDKGVCEKEFQLMKQCFNRARAAR